MKFPRLTFRSALALAAVVSVLAVAPAAGDLTAPVLLVDTWEQQPAADTNVGLIFNRLDTRAQPESIAVTVPQGYTTTLPSLTDEPGLFFLQGKDAAGGDLELDGKLAVVDAATVAPQLAPCAPGAHTAVWQAALGDSATRTVLIAVDSAAGTTKLTICLDALHAENAVVSAVDFETEGLFRNPPSTGTYVWETLVTPYDAAGAVAPANAYELRGDEPLPQTVTIKPTYSTVKKLLTIRGVSSAAGQPRTGIVVHVLGGPHGFEKELGTADVVDGSYVLTLHTAKPPAAVSASISFYSRSCDPTPVNTAPGGCLNESRDGAFSAAAKVTVPKPVKKPVKKKPAKKKPATKKH